METLSIRTVTRVVPDQIEAAKTVTMAETRERKNLFTLGTSSRPDEFKSARYEWPPPEKKRLRIKRETVRTWIKADVVDIATDAQHMRKLKPIYLTP